MENDNRFYGLTNEKIYNLSAKDKIIWAYSFVVGISVEDAEKEITGEDLQEVKNFTAKKLRDQKQAIESFQRLMESIGDDDEPKEERKSVIDLRKEYPHANFYFFGKDGYELKNVYATDKIERYEVKNFHNDEQVIYCYYNR